MYRLQKPLNCRPLNLCPSIFIASIGIRFRRVVYLQIFVEIVKHLYDMDVLEEDTINFWYKKGSVTRGRNVFLNDIQPFIKWLEDAEEDDDDEDGE